MWLFDEVAHAGEEHLDPERVAAYDAKARTDPTPDLRLLVELGLDSTSSLVDLGAGTGTFALAAAQVCARVVAVDVSSGMLDALEREKELRHVENVECVRAGFLTYSHVGPAIDFVYSRNAFHHLPDFWKGIALDRIAAMLRPRGYLRLRDLVFSFDPCHAVDKLEAWLGAAPTRSEDGWTRSELETHLKKEYSTFSWLLEPMLERAGFELVGVEHAASGIYAAYTCQKAR